MPSKINRSSPATIEAAACTNAARSLCQMVTPIATEPSGVNLRRSALATLIQQQPPDLREVCEKLLAVRFLNTVSARGLSQFDDPGIGVLLARNYGRFHPSERPAVIEALVSRPEFVPALLDQMQAGKIPRADVSAARASLLPPAKAKPMTRPAPATAEAFRNCRRLAGKAATVGTAGVRSAGAALSRW